MAAGRSGDHSQPLKQPPMIKTAYYAEVKNLNLASKFLFSVPSSLETFFLKNGKVVPCNFCVSCFNYPLVSYYETEEACCGKHTLGLVGSTQKFTQTWSLIHKTD